MEFIFLLLVFLGVPIGTVVLIVVVLEALSDSKTVAVVGNSVGKVVSGAVESTADAAAEVRIRSERRGIQQRADRVVGRLKDELAAGAIDQAEFETKISRVNAKLDADTSVVDRKIEAVHQAAARRLEAQRVAELHPNVSHVEFNAPEPQVSEPAMTSEEYSRGVRWGWLLVAAALACFAIMVLISAAIQH